MIAPGSTSKSVPRPGFVRSDRGARSLATSRPRYQVIHRLLLYLVIPVAAIAVVFWGWHGTMAPLPREANQPPPAPAEPVVASLARSPAAASPTTSVASPVVAATSSAPDSD